MYLRHHQFVATTDTFGRAVAINLGLESSSAEPPHFCPGLFVEQTPG